MAHDWKMALYGALPVRVQEGVLSLYARRLDRLYYGGVYEQAVRDVKARHFDSTDSVRAWQRKRLTTVLAEARLHVPHYKRLPESCWASREGDQLAGLPLLDKQQIRQRESDFIDDRFKSRSLFKERTSGTTGTSLTVSMDPDSLQTLWGIHEVRVRQAVGVDRFSPRCMLGGRPIIPGGTRKPPFWRYNRHWRQLYLSSYHISRARTKGYVDAIRKAGSVWLTGYGSAIAALAEGALAEGLPPLPLKAVIVSGDTLQPGMRRSIELFFRCRCYDHYGQSEGVCWIMECNQGRMHVIPEFGMLEILDPQGLPCKPGESGEMVVTGLLNTAMPLIRYRTGDEAAWATKPGCACGQPFPVVERIEGRMDDYLITADGRRIGRLSTAMKQSPSIHSAQLVQDNPGHAFLLVKPGHTYQGKDAQVVKEDILNRIGAFSIDIVEVNDIPRTPTGKTRLVVRLHGKPDMTAVYAWVLPVAARRNEAPHEQS